MENHGWKIAFQTGELSLFIQFGNAATTEGTTGGGGGACSSSAVFAPFFGLRRCTLRLRCGLMEGDPWVSSQSDACHRQLRLVAECNGQIVELANCVCEIS